MSHLTNSFLSPLSLSLFALLAAPTAAQFAVAGDATPPAKPAIRLTIAGTDFAVALVALEDDRTRFADGEVLNNAVVMLASNDGSEMFVELPDLDLRLYWQSISVDGTGLRIGAISAIDNTRPKATVLPSQPSDLAIAGEAPAGKLTEVKDDAPSNVVKSDLAETAVDNLPVCTAAPDDGSPSDADLTMVFLPTRTDDDHLVEVYASFIAPTDGYGLGLVDVKGAKPNGAADIYMYRKLPGKGEGQLRVDEKFRLTVLLPKVATARVFLAEGTTSRPGSDTTWREIARF